jgi:hypothetical protein
MAVMETAWPELVPAQWLPTKRTLHPIAQMMGKVRLALAPYEPNFVFTALHLTPNGFTTGPFPVGLRMIELRLELSEPSLELLSSDGRHRSVAFTTLPSIAAVYAALLEALHALDVDVTLSPIPQEVPDTTPLDRDEHAPAFVAEDARRWHTVVSATEAVFEDWRAHFFGRTAIALWWGAFDLSLMLFSGKHVPPPLDRGYLFKYDLDAEMMNAGFYPGDAANEPFFYGYIYPEPDRCDAISVAEGVQWSEQFHEWILPYRAMRAADRPDKLLRSLLDGVYNVCSGAAGWDRSQYTYVPPPLRHAR